MAAAKPHMNLVTIGHVDHGKSTLVGRLLYDSGNIKEEDMRKLKEIAKELKKETFEFAFVMDKLKEERERGVTIDIMHTRFDTPKYYFTIIDAPGHRDFVKNMITGASQADAAILVCSAKEGVQEQTKEHVFLIKVLGVKQMIVAINKMDAVNYDKAKFETLKTDLTKLLQTVGYDVSKILFIPVSAYAGDNVVKKSTNMPWYTGPTLFETLDTLVVPPQPIDKPLRLPIQDVYTITGIGTVPVGRVETGILKTGDTLVFEPSGVKGEVKSIEMHHEQISEAKPGDNIGFSVRGVTKKDIKRGDVAGKPDNPPTVAKEFTAQIIVLQHPNVITVGYTPVFHVHTAQVACKITEIQKKIDAKTGATLQEKPDFIKAGDAAIIKCVPSRPLVIESAKNIPELGRFAIRDMGMTVAAGICLDVVKAK
ncbi:MAG: translation elongation factor EF-1 subunit alpha [Candidatus Aenigmatarchaeota archaeon]|nr:translation elongation factor EF-1 subunit alpha [Candidatus Aenigmarchaeota archaeon]